MNVGLLLLLNVSIGSVIGGVTNELAIRMLFHPYKPWMIGGFRLPFTPGLIPRRRDDISIQMGLLVENHLVTSEGIKRALAHAELERTLSQWLTGYVEGWMREERTLRHLLEQLSPRIFEEGKWSERARQPFYLQWRALSSRLLEHYSDKKLRELIPAEGETKLAAGIEYVSHMLLARFRDHLRSEDGQRTIQHMLRGLLGGGGGMFGGLVGMFLGDDKIVAKLLPFIDELLENPELADKLNGFLHHEAEKALDKRVGDVLGWIGEDQVDTLQERIFEKLEEHALHLVDKPVSEVLGSLRGIVVEELIPRATGWIVHTLEQNVERFFHKLSIQDIVTRQVEGFPIERIEEMIVGISGKEFRMITVLGFLLGGLIGLIQGILYLSLA